MLGVKEEKSKEKLNIVRRTNKNDLLILFSQAATDMFRDVIKPKLLHREIRT
jgi:hypothetical protein